MLGIFHADEEEDESELGSTGQHSSREQDGEESEEEEKEHLPGVLLTGDKEEKIERVLEDAVSGSASHMLPRDSLYGSAIVLPQVARNLEWDMEYVGLVGSALLCMILVFILQGFFVHEVFRLVEQKDLECGKDPVKCEEEGFKQGGMSIFGQSRHRWYLCEPQAAGDAATHFLRKICVLVFTIQMFKDARQTYEMAMLMLAIPSKAGQWLVVLTETEEHIIKLADGTKRLVAKEDSHMEWQIDGMLPRWKIFNFVFLILPKALIWIALLVFGSFWLLNTWIRSELILNAVALVFVLDLDEAVFAAISTADTQQYMDKLQPWNPLSKTTKRNDLSKLSNQILRFFKICFNVIAFPIALVLAAVLQVVYYNVHCAGIEI